MPCRQPGELLEATSTVSGPRLPTPMTVGLLKRAVPPSPHQPPNSTMGTSTGPTFVLPRLKWGSGMWRWLILAFVTASVFRAPGDLRPILLKFGIETWILLGLMAFSLGASITCALLALWSRGVLLRRVSQQSQLTQSINPGPDSMGLFEDIRRLERESFRRALHNIDHAFVIDELGSSLFVLASNVSKKHRWLDLGFALSGATLLLFLGAAASYFAHSIMSP